MKALGKTKIIRVQGGECYFKIWETDDGPRYEEFIKDTSALIPSMRDTKFKSMNIWKKEPVPYDSPIIPIPPDFGTDMLGKYARVEYAKGHEPIKPLRMR